MYTFSFSMIVLHACALTFIISSTNARNEKYPVVFSAPKDALKKNPINARDFKMAYLNEIVDENTFEFEVYNEGDQLIYACPANSQDTEELNKLGVHQETLDFGLLVTSFADTQPKICDSKIKVHFVTKLDEEGGLMTLKENDVTFLFLGGYMFLHDMDYARNYLKKNPTDSNDKRKIPFTFLQAYDYAMDVNTYKLVWTHYFMEASPEIAIENRYAQSPDNEDYEYYNEADTEFQKRFKAISDAFQKHKEKTYVPELHVPQEHLQFSLRRCAKHYANAEPIHKDLAPLMRVINKRILEYSAKFETYYDNFTEYLSIYSLTIFLEENKAEPKILFDNELPDYYIPHVWVKVIYNIPRNMGTVIYLHNTLEDVAEKKLCPVEYRVECDFNKWAVGMNDVPKLWTSQAYCCKIHSYIRLSEVLPIDLTLREDFLDIDNLVVPEIPDNLGDAGEQTDNLAAMEAHSSDAKEQSNQ